MFTHMVFWFPADDNIREGTDHCRGLGRWVVWGRGLGWKSQEWIPLNGRLEVETRGRQDWGPRRAKLRAWRCTASGTWECSVGGNHQSMFPSELTTATRVQGSFPGLCPPRKICLHYEEVTLVIHAFKNLRAACSHRLSWEQERNIGQSLP